MNVLIAADAAKRRFKMKTFTIENETNNITIHATAKAAEATLDSERFSSEAGLAKLAANWPAARLTEIWNSLPGATQIRKFKDRPTAVSRIWKAIQSFADSAPVAQVEADAMPVVEAAPSIDENNEASLEAQPEAEVPETPFDAPVLPQTPNVAPEATPTKNKASRAKKALTVAEKGPREGSKTDTILALMKQPGGTTVKTIMEATQWQAHSVRGFISGTLGKKMGLTVVSAKGENGERSYSINA
jgi:hypothetical protein